TVQGDVQSASVSTYMAINGNGFFVVQKPGSFTDNQPVFSGVDNYTRRGDFALDKNGYLVNGAGYYVEGVGIDPATGNMTGSVPQILKFANDFLPAVPTSVVNYRANLASYPLTTKHDTSVPGSELLRPADFASGNPRSLGTPAAPYVDATITGAAKNNKAAAPGPITGSTLLNGAIGTDSLTTNFVSGDTITVDGTVISIVNTPTNLATNEINVTTGTIQDLLTNIGAITGVAPTISGGAITLHTGTTNDLTISTTNTTAFGALGLTSPVSVLRSGGGTAGTGQVLGSDLQAFINESVSGGAVTAYDISGSPVSLQLRWAKVDTSSLGAGHTDTWNLFYQVNSNATGTDLAWQNVNTDFTFSPNGQMSPAIAGITLTAPTIGGVPLGNVAINFGAGGVTQFADSNGNVKVNQIQQDGFPAGSLQTVSIGENGRVVGNYSNGRNIDLAQISVATFNGTNFLKRIDGGAFEATDQSGSALYGSGGTIVGSSLESSNTDIADEFTKLIVTQQAYSANTKVITTANSMVQDLLNVMR
ncbi:MAG: flagellar hook-basal body complex protein, partial [Bradyrhizobium sp.]